MEDFDPSNATFPAVGNDFADFDLSDFDLLHFLDLASTLLLSLPSPDFPSFEPPFEPDLLVPSPDFPDLDPDFPTSSAVLSIPSMLALATTRSAGLPFDFSDDFPLDFPFDFGTSSTDLSTVTVRHFRVVSPSVLK